MASNSYADAALTEVEQNGSSEYTDYLLDNADRYADTAHGQYETAEEHARTSESYLADAAVDVDAAQSSLDAGGYEAAGAGGYEAGGVDAVPQE